MLTDPRIKKDVSRWYDLRPIEEQIRLINSTARFRIICAGRRSGKTERAKRYLIKQAMLVPGMYFVAAPTIPQVRLIYWDDMIRMCLPALPGVRVHESKLCISLPNGSKIYFLGMEHPKRFEGPEWTGGLLDEFAYFKEDAWSLSIRPALDTESPERPGYKPWCWLLSKPNGLNHFFRMYNYAKTANDPEWEAFHWLSSEVLTPEKIQAAMRTMSVKQFRQEYEASFETVSGRIYEDYSDKNTTDSIILPHEEICYTCDFNYTPMSHALGVIRDSKIQGKQDILILDEIILTSAVARNAAMEFVERYKNHENKKLRLYGDASGSAGEKHGQESNFIGMMEIFRNAGWEVDRRTHKANPAIVDRQNALRAKVCNAAGERTFFINPSKAEWSHQGMLTVQVKKGSTFQEETKDNPYQHITTAIGYEAEYEFRIEDAIREVNVMWLGDHPGYGDY